MATQAKTAKPKAMQVPWRFLSGNRIPAAGRMLVRESGTGNEKETWEARPKNVRKIATYVIIYNYICIHIYIIFIHLCREEIPWFPTSMYICRFTDPDHWLVFFMHYS